MQNCENSNTNIAMTSKKFTTKSIVWWGRSDVHYSRNGVIRNAMGDLSISIIDFTPRLSKFGHLEAAFSSLGDVDALWVPCFRQRDMLSATKWAKVKNKPIIFDPLISAYDKQVFERKKFLPTSSAAKKLLKWESNLFQLADVVLADTSLHAKYFEEVLGVNPEQICIVPVSAEESMFTFREESSKKNTQHFRILYFGNYLELHGVDVVAGAILRNTNNAIWWTFVGDGPTRNGIEKKCKDALNVEFIDPIDYQELPKCIHDADLVLGIFDTGEKASRVIPNKVYQALACGRQVATIRSEAYPKEMLNLPSGVHWVEAGNSSDLLSVIEKVIETNSSDDSMLARESYEKFFSNNIVKESLEKAFTIIPK